MPLPKKIPKELASKSSCAGKVYANRYKVIKRLGSGNFGTAFLVEDLRAQGERYVQLYCINYFAFDFVYACLCIINSIPVVYIKLSIHVKHVFTVN